MKVLLACAIVFFYVYGWIDTLHMESSTYKGILLSLLIFATLPLFGLVFYCVSIIFKGADKDI